MASFLLFRIEFYSIVFLTPRVTWEWVSKRAERERHFRAGERADSLDRTLFRLPALTLSFYSTNSGQHFAGFPVAIETRGICVNCALVNEIIMFGINPKLISRISRSPSLFYSVYLKIIATFFFQASEYFAHWSQRITTPEWPRVCTFYVLNIWSAPMKTRTRESCSRF